jgi:hypothetical protein
MRTKYDLSEFCMEQQAESLNLLGWRQLQFRILALLLCIEVNRFSVYLDYH